MIDNITCTQSWSVSPALSLLWRSKTWDVRTEETWSLICWCEGEGWGVSVSVAEEQLRGQWDWPCQRGSQSCVQHCCTAQPRPVSADVTASPAGLASLCSDTHLTYIPPPVLQTAVLQPPCVGGVDCVDCGEPSVAVCLCSGGGGGDSPPYWLGWSGGGGCVRDLSQCCQPGRADHTVSSEPSVRGWAVAPWYTTSLPSLSPPSPCSPLGPPPVTCRKTKELPGPGPPGGPAPAQEISEEGEIRGSGDWRELL